MLAPAFGAPKAVSAASLASKLAKTLKIAKRADRNAKRAIAGLQSQGGRGEPGGQGVDGPAGPKGDKGEPGAAGNTGATGPAGPEGPEGPQGVQGDPCLPIDPACRGPQGSAGTKGDKGDKGDTGAQGTQGPSGNDGPPGPAGPSAGMVNFSIGNGTTNHTVAISPHFSLRFNCTGPSTHRLFTMAVLGSGGVQLSGAKSIQDDANSTIPFVKGAGLPTAPDFVGVGVGHPNPNNTQGLFYRMNGSFVVHDNLRLVTVGYDMFLENRGNAGTCHFRGTAVRAGLE